MQQHSSSGGDMQSKMNAFMQEEVEFDEPAGHCGYSQSVSVKCCNNQASKTVTRTYNLSNGGTCQMNDCDSLKNTLILLVSYS